MDESAIHVGLFHSHVICGIVSLGIRASQILRHSCILTLELKDSSKNIAVCITGQIHRLELQTKAAAFCLLDLGAVLSASLFMTRKIVGMAMFILVSWHGKSYSRHLAGKFDPSPKTRTGYPKKSILSFGVSLETFMRAICSMGFRGQFFLSEDFIGILRNPSDDFPKEWPYKRGSP